MDLAASSSRIGIPMVHMAIASGLPVFPNGCLRRGGSKCHAFDACLKQENINEIAQADVVVAPYDTLFTGLSIASKDIALLVIDEGCWARALTEGRGLYVETLAHVGLSLEPKWEDREAEAQAWQDLFALRSLAAKALARNGPGPLARNNLVDVGLTAETCAKAAALEAQLCPDPALQPGLPQGARKRALELSQEASRSIRRQKLFDALAQLLHGEVASDGRLRVLPPDAKTGLQEIVITGLHGLDADFVGKPVLHLDATLRTELAATILPGLEVTEISAAMPHMALTLVQGSFGKTSLCHDPRAAPGENQRRANRLRECVDYVRWQTKRMSPGRVLVVTYKDCEAAYSGIPGVEVAHFNAIAGLDIYRDVALLIVIGRPLPPSGALHPMAGGYFSVEPVGTYEKVLRSVPMRDGNWRNIRVTQHQDPSAEILRAAICDDELIQAIGRGRGVNRMADTPLKVHVLADVALPLVHDRVLAWDAVAPDIVQRMLMAGMAVDSPADAAALHPDLFDGAEQARKACDRAGFNGQNPMYNTYREMSVKSARYRKGGRGSSWQRSFWITGSADDARHRLESAIGPVADWKLLNV